MSLPDEEARALRYAQEFLLELSSGRPIAGKVTELRREARRILRHYPPVPEDYAARAWDDGWQSGKRGYLISHNPHVTTAPEEGQL